MNHKRKFNDKEKWCPRCESWLPLDEFADKPSSKSPSKKEAYCRLCKKKYDRKCFSKDSYKTKRNLRQRWYARFRKYGLTEEQLQQMLVSQDHRCAICRDPITLEAHGCHVDHDHQTGIVRGLLCGLCNRGLGNFKDNRRLLQSAIAYLDKATSSGCC